MSNIFAGLLQTSISSVNFPDFSNYLIYGGFFLFGSTVVNFSLMSPKLVRIYPHVLENRGITLNGEDFFMISISKIMVPL